MVSAVSYTGLFNPLLDAIRVGFLEAVSVVFFVVVILVVLRLAIPMYREVSRFFGKDVY